MSFRSRRINAITYKAGMGGTQLSMIPSGWQWGQAETLSTRYFRPLEVEFLLGALLLSVLMAGMCCGHLPYRHYSEYVNLIF